MTRFQTLLYAALLAFIVLAVSRAAAVESHETLDPAFTKIPFDQWLSGGEQAQIRWSAHVAHADLSFHQRLAAKVEVKLDGRDLAKLRGDGELVVFLQIRDSSGTKYQSHGTIDLAKLDEAIKSADLTYEDSAFFVPGDYQLAAAIYDTKTREHSVRQENFRVASFKNDSLPELWSDLPPVEFMGPQDPPEGWFLPSVKGRLHGPSAATAPARIDIVLNVAPSEKNYRSGSVYGGSRSLSALIPVAKAIAQIGSPAATVNLEMIDISRRRVVYRQNKISAIDWSAMSSSLSEANTGTIDLKSLGERHRNAAFFATEVAKVAATGTEPVHLVIVLASPMTFDSGEDLHPVDVERGGNTRVFYLRYYSHQLPGRPTVFGPGMGRRRPGLAPPPRNFQESAIDELEPVLKQLAPKLFDIETPDQARHAIAAMVAALR